MKDGKIFFNDLEASGPVIMYLFGAQFPDGMTPEEMQHSALPWVRRAYERFREERENG